MKQLRSRALGLVAAAVLSLAPAAAAQETRWTDPTGFVSFDLAASGWDALDRARYAEVYEDDEVLIATPGGENVYESRCSLNVMSQPAPPGTREQANAITRRLAESATVSGAVDDPRFTLDRVESPEIDGVVLLDIYGDFLNLRTLQRRFFVHGDNEVLMYTFACAVENDRTVDIAASLAISNSIRFPGETN